MELPFACEECAGKGVDPGSVNDPEPCTVCFGSGSQLIEMDTRSSLNGVRKPMGRGLPQRITHGELAERKYRFGGVE